MIVMIALAMLCVSTYAHETKTVGPYLFTVGFATEPAFRYPLSLAFFSSLILKCILNHPSSLSFSSFLYLFFLCFLFLVYIFIIVTAIYIILIIYNGFMNGLDLRVRNATDRVGISGLDVGFFTTITVKQGSFAPLSLDIEPSMPLLSLSSSSSLRSPSLFILIFFSF